MSCSTSSSDTDRFLEPVVTATVARERLGRRAFERFGRSRRSDSGSSAGNSGDRRLPFLELVWLPHYRLTVELEGKHRTAPVEVLVGAIDGHFALVDLARVQWRRAPPTSAFEAHLGPDEAVATARERLLRTILQVPGLPSRPHVGQVLATSLIHYPFWVWYYQRRRGILDFKMLDGMTGSAAGARLKVAFLQALQSVEDDADRRR